VRVSSSSPSHEHKARYLYGIPLKARAQSVIAVKLAQYMPVKRRGALLLPWYVDVDLHDRDA
jgi:hypothetical protein